MSVKQQLADLFRSKSSGPFLFLGSGFSRRYLGLEDWAGLLGRFCTPDKPFGYYRALANNDLPAAAALIAKDFNKRWWMDEEFRAAASEGSHLIRTESSALRMEICKYLSGLKPEESVNGQYSEEVGLLKSLNVDGVITTNWDGFVDYLFPDYKVYVGQTELLFANPQEIGEIYKIHGGCSSPESLVLTDDDYRDFAEKNVYLAAKLITVFVEHPVVFIGYSLSDENIQRLLRSISLCIGEENVLKLRQNLVFVQRLKVGEVEGVSDTYFAIDGVQIPIVLVKTNDFSDVYRAIEATKRKIPARVLRFCKEQMYEVVKSGNPEEKLCVMDVNQIERSEDIEFVVGIGVVGKDLSAIGYSSIQVSDLMHDLLFDNKNYVADLILKDVIKNAGRNTPNVPVFKYLRVVGVGGPAEYRKSGYALDKWVVRQIKDYRTESYAKTFRTKCKGMDAEQIVEAFNSDNAAIHLAFLSQDKFDLGIVRAFLIDNLSRLVDKEASFPTAYRKLAALYDKMKYGW